MVLTALRQNSGAQESPLYIFSDASRGEDDIEDVKAVRKLSRNVKGFAEITVTERPVSFGLAENIIAGVSEVVKRHGRVIVLEDDIVTSPGFLRYMNDALDFYEKKPRVMHISGWNYPIDPRSLPDTFLWRVMNCWGWATWADRWQFFSKNSAALIAEFSRDDIYRFDVDRYGDFWSQVTRNQLGEIDTWAVFWYASIFKRDGLCLNPSQSLVRNIGHDGSGENSGNLDFYDRPLRQKAPQHFCATLVENKAALRRIQDLMLRQSYSGGSLSWRYWFKRRGLAFLRILKNAFSTIE